MEAIVMRADDLIGTANADLSPSVYEYQRLSDDLAASGRQIHEMDRPPAAEKLVEKQASSLITLSYAFNSEALGNNASLYLNAAERLRVRANLACAGV
jgi:hypothetical protein